MPLLVGLDHAVTGKNNTSVCESTMHVSIRDAYQPELLLFECYRYQQLFGSWCLFGHSLTRSLFEDSFHKGAST